MIWLEYFHSRKVKRKKENRMLLESMFKMMADFNQSMNENERERTREKKRVWTKQRRRRRIGHNWRFLLLIILKSPKGICLKFSQRWRTRWISSKSISSKFITVRQVPYDCNVSLLADVNRPMHILSKPFVARRLSFANCRNNKSFLCPTWARSSSEKSGNNARVISALNRPRYKKNISTSSRNFYRKYFDHKILYQSTVFPDEFLLELFARLENVLNRNRLMFHRDQIECRTSAIFSRKIFFYSIFEELCRKIRIGKRHCQCYSVVDLKRIASRTVFIKSKLISGVGMIFSWAKAIRRGKKT